MGIQKLNVKILIGILCLLPQLVLAKTTSLKVDKKAATTTSTEMAKPNRGARSLKSITKSMGADVVQMRIKVTHASLVTEMTLAPAGNATLGTMKNNRGLNVKQNLEKTDFAYAQKQFYVAADSGHASCPKSFIEISYFNASGKIISSASNCYREKTPISKLWTESVETLAKVIHFQPDGKGK